MIKIELYPLWVYPSAMQSIRKILILIFAALMAFSPLALQASACFDGSMSATAQCHEVSDCREQASVVGGQDQAVPDGDHKSEKQDCAGCCMAHTAALPAATEPKAKLPSPKLIAIKLPRDWAGVINLAPDALLRPPRA